ncbi:MAG TPA: hypothetical protein VKE74_35155 [Gemmataceae bacterium]|nr:hypothetical protein [Gemmataceae bacterium]
MGKAAKTGGKKTMTKSAFVTHIAEKTSLTKVKAVKGGVEKINPLNGQKYITKDKPAYNKVNIRPIKAIKEALK